MSSRNRTQTEEVCLVDYLYEVIWVLVTLLSWLERASLCCLLTEVVMESVLDVVNRASGNRAVPVVWSTWAAVGVITAIIQ